MFYDMAIFIFHDDFETSKSAYVRQKKTVTVNLLKLARNTNIFWKETCSPLIDNVSLGTSTHVGRLSVCNNYYNPC